MKLTKRQLKRIIREEKSKLLEESAMPNSQTGTAMAEQIAAAMRDLMDEHFHPGEWNTLSLNGLSRDMQNAIFEIVARYTNDSGLE
tara:strand:- start:653 stop:910 length:258 start_codon:yes stop_codon:yes gene_type:complete